MFVVTKDGVIATDPVAYGRPTAAIADCGAAARNLSTTAIVA